MPTVSFIGRVLPAPVQISFTDIPKPSWEWVEEHIKIDFTIHIEKSRVQVDCELDSYKDEYMVELHRRVFDLARVCVNVAAFGTGFGLYVIFEQFVLPNGVVTELIFTAPPDLVAECTAFKMNAVTTEEKKVMEQILALVMGEPALFMLLNDLIQCLSIPHVTPVNCGRVIDGLRKLITPGDPEKAWPPFRNEMHVDEAYTKFVSENSKEHRHGGHLRIDGPTTTEILKRTWIIMNRFIEYRKSGNKPLSLTKFPLLMG
jgi:hypothetical protein